MFGEKRKEETICQINQKLNMISEEILSHNRLVIEIVKYLLCLETGNEKAGFVLIKLIFGKSAGKLFVKQGINNTLMEKRLEMFKFLQTKIKEKFAECPNRGKNELNFKVNLSKKTRESQISTDKDLSSTENLLINNSKTNPQSCVNPQKIDNQILQNNIISLMKIYGIPMKYIDHWLWLHRNSGIFPEKFVSFHELICTTYNLDPRNQNEDFKIVFKDLGLETF